MRIDRIVAGEKRAPAGGGGGGGEREMQKQMGHTLSMLTLVCVLLAFLLVTLSLCRSLGILTLHVGVGNCCLSSKLTSMGPGKIGGGGVVSE